MSGPQQPAIYALSEAASSLFHRIPELLHRLRELDKEEARLDARARQLVGYPPDTIDRPSTLSLPIISTPVSKLRIRVTESMADRVTPSTPPHVDPRNIGTPVKAFLLESFALAMSVKSKRKGRILLAGDSTEFGKRK